MVAEQLAPSATVPRTKRTFSPRRPLTPFFTVRPSLLVTDAPETNVGLAVGRQPREPVTALEGRLPVVLVAAAPLDAELVPVVGIEVLGLRSGVSLVEVGAPLPDAPGHVE